MGARRPEGLVERRLPSGARVLVLPQPRGPVAIQLWIFAGTSAETPREHGCAHLLEHMLFKPRADGSDIATAIEELGGDVNAYTSHDETVFHATVPAAAMRDALEALCGPVVAPALDPEELRREAQVVIEEIKQYDDDPAGRGAQDLVEILFDGHSYGRPVLGRKPEVLGHTAKRLAAFHRSVYTADRVALIVVGPVKPRTVVKLGRAMLGGLASHGRRLAARTPGVSPAPQVRVRTAPVHESHVALGWHGPALPDARGCALEVAAVVLGYGEASRLSAYTRRRDQLVTDAHASFYGARDASSVVITANTKPDGILAAAEAILAQVEQLRRVPITDDELSRALAVLRSEVVYRSETVQGLAHALGYHLSLAGSVHAQAQYFAALDGLTPHDVRLACAQYMASSRTSATVVAPKPQRPRTADLRRAIDRTGKRRAAVGRVRTRRGVQWVDLPGGLRVRAVIDRSVPMVAGWLVWPGGLRLEQPRDLGASPIMAALLTRGTTRQGGDALAQEIEGRAAVLEGFAGRSSAGLHFECLAADLPTVLSAALDCATDPLFAAAELDEERRVALEDLEAEQDDYGGLAFRAALRGLYGGHPFRLRRRGTTNTLGRLRPARLRKLWQTNYPLGRAVLALTGDVDLQGALELAAAALPPGGSPPPAIQWPGGPPKYPTRQSVRRLSGAQEQSHLAVLYPGLPFSDPRLETLEVLTTVLGGQAGRLFTALREKRGLVYHVAASASEGIDGGHVSVYAATSHTKLARARAAVDAELERIANEPVGADELERAKAWLTGQHEVGMQRRSHVSSQLGFNEVYALGMTCHLDYARKIARIRAEDVQSLARALLNPSRRVIGIVSRASN